MAVNFLTQKYSRRGLEYLFLTCAFLPHFWTLLLAFRDISWLAERTNMWDAIGVLSYGMVFAFVESVVIFLVLLVLGFVTPGHWQSDQRIAFLALLILIVSGWVMISQLFFLWNVSLPIFAVQFLRNSNHPVRILYGATLGVVTTTVLLPVYLFIKSAKAVVLMQSLMERLSLLTIFYLIFDGFGLVIVMIRNFS